MNANLSGNMWSIVPVYVTIVRSEGESVSVGLMGDGTSNLRRALGRQIVGVLAGWTALQDGWEGWRATTVLFRARTLGLRDMVLMLPSHSSTIVVRLQKRVEYDETAVLMLGSATEE